MSSLWKGNQSKTNEPRNKKSKKKQIKKLQQTSQKRPSPKHNSDYQFFAQKISKSNLICRFIKRISLFISRSRQINASMTVEAAIVLPLFLFFFLNLGCAIEMIRLHGNLEFALCDIGNRMAVYGYALSGAEERAEEGVEESAEENEWVSELQDVAFSYTYVKSEITDYLGAEYLDGSPIVDGAQGLHFLESEIFDGEDCFEIIATYKVAPLSSVAGFRSFRMMNRYYGHLWNGYQIPGADEGSVETDVFYVAENGVVYHTDRHCTHLSLSVREVSIQEAYVRRNANGQKYDPCLRCKNSGVTGSVYITDDGESIHYRSDCAGLMRTIYQLSEREAREYRACSRCAG